MIGSDAMIGAPQWPPAMDGHGVGADALDMGAERDQEPGEILHMGLGGAVAQDRHTFCRDRGTQRILRCGHRGFVEEYVRAP
ncbi:hypothetical protein D3C86_2178080 [compost metagenome]